MAAVGSTVATLADWAKRLDPDGSVPTVVEMLGQTNEVLTDMQWLEGNLPTGHRTTVRTSIPTPTWRRLNEGVTPGKSTTAQVDEQCGMLEAYSQVDVDLAMLNGNAAAFRLSEGQAFIEGMNQEMAGTLFYGNAGVDQQEFTGIAPRYNLSTGNTADNVLLAGGTGSDNTSIYLVCWGAGTVHGIFPKASKAGLVHEDLGEQLIQTSTGIGSGTLKAYVDRWQWKCGIAVRDPRYIVRIANIDVSATVADTAGTTWKLIELMAKALHRIPALGMGKPVFYMNRSIMQMLDIQSMNKSTLALNLEEVQGKKVLAFRGIPVRLCDQIVENETLVS